MKFLGVLLDKNSSLRTHIKQVQLQWTTGI